VNHIERFNTSFKAIIKNKCKANQEHGIVLQIRVFKNNKLVYFIYTEKKDYKRVKDTKNRIILLDGIE
jgi:hypothetical protein